MNPVQSRQIVLASMASTAVIVIAGNAAGKEHRLPDTRTLGGLAFGFLFLSVMSDFAPAVAGPLSIVVMLTSLVVPVKGSKKSAGEIFLNGINNVPTTDAKD